MFHPGGLAGGDLGGGGLAGVDEVTSARGVRFS